MADSENIDLNGDGTIDKDELSIASARWETKRKIVWLSIIGIFLFGFIIIGISIFVPELTEAKLKVLSDMIDWIFFGFTSIIGAYFGFSTYDLKKK